MLCKLENVDNILYTTQDMSQSNRDNVYCQASFSKEAWTLTACQDHGSVQTGRDQRSAALYSSTDIQARIQTTVFATSAVPPQLLQTTDPYICRKEKDVLLRTEESSQ